MTTHRKIGVAVVLFTAMLAVAGLVMGYLSITIAVGIAVIGILIGTAVARGRFSNATNVTKRN
jgi:general stress protein CsbA